MDNKGLIETGKSFARFLYFGVLALVVQFLTDLLSRGDLNDTTITVGGFTMSLGVVLVGVIAAALKAIDRYIHTSETVDAKGIAPEFLQR